MQRFTHHDTYIEVFAGGETVLFAKKQSKIEIINELNSNVVNLYEIDKVSPRRVYKRI